MLTRRVRTSHATARISSVSVCNYYFVLTAFIAGLQFHTTLHPFTSNHFPNCRTSRNQTLPNSSHHLPSKPHVYVRPQSPKTLPKTLGKNFRKFFTCRSTQQFVTTHLSGSHAVHQEQGFPGAVQHWHGSSNPCGQRGGTAQCPMPSPAPPSSFPLQTS